MMERDLLLLTKYTYLRGVKPAIWLQHGKSIRFSLTRMATGSGDARYGNLSWASTLRTLWFVSAQVGEPGTWLELQSIAGGARKCKHRATRGVLLQSVLQMKTDSYLGGAVTAK
jgi:hypothetical protein